MSDLQLLAATQELADMEKMIDEIGALACQKAQAEIDDPATGEEARAKARGFVEFYHAEKRARAARTALDESGARIAAHCERLDAAVNAGDDGGPEFLLLLGDVARDSIFVAHKVREGTSLMSTILRRQRPGPELNESIGKLAAGFESLLAMRQGIERILAAMDAPSDAARVLAYLLTCRTA